MVLAKQDEWNKAGLDVVVLHQFPRAKKAPNISPYCLKLETFLRVHKINYIVEEDNALNGPTKQAPWITFNGVNHGDSQGCIDLLAEKFNVDVNPGMSDEDKAVYESFRALIEDRLIPMMALERFFWLKCDDFKELTPPIFPSMIPSFMHNFVWNHIGKGTKKTSPFGKLTHEELASKSLKVMKSLSQFLGSKRFFFGDQMTLLDIIVHGFTTQVYYMSPDSSKIKQNYETLQNMVDHCKTVKEVVYPDWEDLLYKAK